MNVFSRVLILAILSIVLSGCDDGLKRSLGITHEAPDEYAVLKHPPLSVPPNFELAPPSETPVKKVQNSKEEKIQFSKTKPVAAKAKRKGLSSADKEFMGNFSKHEKRSDIREILAEEEKSEAAEEKSKSEPKKKSTLIGKIKSWF